MLGEGGNWFKSQWVTSCSDYCISWFSTVFLHECWISIFKYAAVVFFQILTEQAGLCNTAALDMYMGVL